MKNLMDFTSSLEEILSNLIKENYTISKQKCQELLHQALNEKKEYEDYLDELAIVHRNRQRMDAGLTL